jgi:hypothetical protein
MYKTLLCAFPLALLAACEVRFEAEGDGGGPDEAPVAVSLTETEAREAVWQVNRISRPDAASAEVIDLSTDITIGDRIDLITDRWQEFWENQAPCNTVTFAGNIVTIDFGTLEDACVFDGHTYAGIDTITLTQILDFDADLRVDHDWDGFTNGTVTMTGHTGVYWNGEGARHSELDYVVTNFVDDTSIEVVGQQTIRRLDEALPVAEGGFQLDGDRTWDDGSGAWTMELNELSLLVDDASPHAGDVVITGPQGKQMTIAFSRVDDDTTQAIVTGPEGEVFVVRITAEGELSVD